MKNEAHEDKEITNFVETEIKEYEQELKKV